MLKFFPISTSNHGESTQFLRRRQTMSDIKIQSTNPDELKGGDTFVDNNSDAEILSRNATTQSVVFRSFPPAPDVAPGSAGLCSPAPGRGPIENVNSMFVAAPVAVSVKHAGWVRVCR